MYTMQALHVAIRFMLKSLEEPKLPGAFFLLILCVFILRNPTCCNLKVSLNKIVDTSLHMAQVLKVGRIPGL